MHLMATYVDARFADDRFVPFGNDTLNISGNRTPYAPRWLLTAGLTFEIKNGFALRVLANHIGAQHGDILNRETPTSHGREGKINPYTLLDASIHYTLKEKYIFNISVKNLTNARYIASRRPQGIRLGLPTFFTAGVDIRL